MPLVSSKRGNPTLESNPGPHKRGRLMSSERVDLPDSTALDSSAMVAANLKTIEGDSVVV